MTQTWLPIRSFLGVHPYDYFAKISMIFALLVGMLYVVFVISPWVRLKLFYLFDVWYRGVSAVLVTVFLLVGLFGMMGTTSVYIYSVVFDIAYQNDQLGPMLEADRQNGGVFFGLPKTGLLHMAEAAVLSVFAIIVFIPLNIGLVYFYREGMIPWFQNLKRPKRILSLNATRILVVMGWSISVCVVFWQLKALRFFARIIRDGSLDQITLVPPTDEHPILAFGLTKAEWVILFDMSITPMLLVGLSAMTVYVFRPLFITTISFFAQWPNASTPSIRSIYVVVAGVSVSVWIPYLYSGFPIIEKLVGL